MHHTDHGRWSAALLLDPGQRQALIRSAARAEMISSIASVLLASLAVWAFTTPISGGRLGTWVGGPATLAFSVSLTVAAISHLKRRFLLLFGSLHREALKTTLPFPED